MDELHEEQMTRIDEIEEELDEAMRQLHAFIEEFMKKYLGALEEAFKLTLRRASRKPLRHLSAGFPYILC